MAAMVRALGFAWAREFDMTWGSLDDGKDGFNFTELDKRIATYQRHRLQVLGILGGTPRRYSTVPDTFKAWNAGCFPPEGEQGLAAWRAYAAAMAKRYGATIRDWETWNEPFLPGFLIGSIDAKGKPQHAAPEAFVALHRAAAEGLRSAGLPLRVLWCTGAHVDPAWERKAGELGAWEVTDALTYHHYHGSPLGFPNDSNEQSINHVRALIGERKLAYLNSEGGNAGNVSNPYPLQAPGNRRARDREVADWWVRYYLSTLANGSERFFAYAFYGHGDWRANYDMLNQDGSVSFCATSISNLAWHVEGLQFLRRVELAADLTAFAFTGADRSAIALAPRGAERRYPAPGDGWTARDVFGNEVTGEIVCRSHVVWLHGPGGEAATTAALEALASGTR